MTNREKINKMTNEELARWVYDMHLETSCFEQQYKIKEWLDTEIEPTADEMFEEMGYKKDLCKGYHECVFTRRNEDDADEIVIDKTNYGYYYIKHRILYSKYFFEEYTRSHTITESEDKAIHKKIEELKNETNNM